MISWIVASHDDRVLYGNLLSTWKPIGDDEILIIRGASSIAQAYNQGTEDAQHPVRCFVHHDVRILDLDRLRAALLECCTPAFGMVGVIGSQTANMPWWEGAVCGSVTDARLGELGRGPGGLAEMLDGLLLATVQPLVWDETYPGWHGYDHDACQQMRTRGLPNWCLDNGAELVHHNTTGPASVDRDGWQAAVEHYRAKWEGVPA